MTETVIHTTAQRDLLIAPWAAVCGLPEGLIGTKGDDDG